MHILSWKHRSCVLAFLIYGSEIIFVLALVAIYFFRRISGILVWRTASTIEDNRLRSGGHMWIQRIGYGIA
jgi:hypothetical protein